MSSVVNIEIILLVKINHVENMFNILVNIGKIFIDIIELKIN